MKEKINKFIKENNLVLLYIEQKNNYKYYLHLKCGLCGKEFERSYYAIKQKLKFYCNDCVRKIKKESNLKKNYIEFKKYVHENSKAEFISTEFEGWNIIHNFKCECGKPFKTRPSDFKTRKIKDKIKSVYCQENNIKLVRIPYWDFNKIECILKDEDIV